MWRQRNRTLPRRLRAAREAQGHSLRALAKQTGLSDMTIGLIEHGRVSPKLETLEILAQTLGVRVAWLIGEATHTPLDTATAQQ